MSNDRRAFSSSYLFSANPEPPGDPSKPDALPTVSQTRNPWIGGAGAQSVESSQSEVMGSKTPTGRDHIGARQQGESCCVKAGSEEEM